MLCVGVCVCVWVCVFCNMWVYGCFCVDSCVCLCVYISMYNFYLVLNKSTFYNAVKAFSSKLNQIPSSVFQFLLCVVGETDGRTDFLADFVKQPKNMYASVHNYCFRTRSVFPKHISGWLKVAPCCVNALKNVRHSSCHAVRYVHSAIWLG